VTTGSDNPYPKVIVVEGTAPASPAAGRQALYIDTADHKLKRKNSSGTVTDLEAGGSALTVQDEGSSLATAATTINFTGAGVTASGTGATKTVNIPGGGGGSSSPAPVQSVRTASAQTTNQSTTIAAAASGNRLLVCVGLLNRAVTSLSCTNVTWTLMKAKVSSTTHVEVWVGVVAGGSSGTTLTVNTGTNDWINTHVMELTDALTPTLGTVSEANGTTAGSLAWLAGPITPTAGQLVVGALAMGGGAGAWPSFPGVNFVTAYPGDWPGSMDIAYATGQKMFYGTNASHAGDTYVVFLAPIT
jgi:hypothetical protein